MPIKYIPFIPEPVEGPGCFGKFQPYSALQGRGRAVHDAPAGNAPVRDGEAGDRGREHRWQHGHSRRMRVCLRLFERAGIQVDLVYIDPPFASGADYAKKVYIRRNPKVAEAIAQVERELDVDELKAFEEKMYGDVWDKEKYLSWMYENLMAIKGVMSETASIYVHLDYHIGHYVKILMDEIFGRRQFPKRDYLEARYRPQ